MFARARVGFINFISGPNCHFLAARKGIFAAQRSRERQKSRRGTACLGQRGIKAGAPSLYAIYDTFFKRANIRQRGSDCTDHYEAP